MSYVLTLWLFWAAPYDAALVRYEAPSCAAALNEIIEEAAADGITAFRVLDCVMVQTI